MYETRKREGEREKRRKALDGGQRLTESATQRALLVTRRNTRRIRRRRPKSVEKTRMKEKETEEEEGRKGYIRVG